MAVISKSIIGRTVTEKERWVVGGVDADNLNQKHENTIQNAKTCPVCVTCIKISDDAWDHVQACDKTLPLISLTTAPRELPRGNTVRILPSWPTCRPLDKLVAASHPDLYPHAA
jgi:hypothetical protein